MHRKPRHERALVLFLAAENGNAVEQCRKLRALFGLARTLDKLPVLHARKTVYPPARHIRGFCRGLLLGHGCRKFAGRRKNVRLLLLYFGKPLGFRVLLFRALYASCLQLFATHFLKRLSFPERQLLHFAELCHKRLAAAEGIPAQCVLRLPVFRSHHDLIDGFAVFVRFLYHGKRLRFFLDLLLLCHDELGDALGVGDGFE